MFYFTSHFSDLVQQNNQSVNQLWRVLLHVNNNKNRLPYLYLLATAFFFIGNITLIFSYFVVPIFYLIYFAFKTNAKSKELVIKKSIRTPQHALRGRLKLLLSFSKSTSEKSRQPPVHICFIFFCPKASQILFSKLMDKVFDFSFY